MIRLLGKGRISLHERNSTIASLIGKSIDISRQKQLVLIAPNEEIVYTSWEMIQKRHLSADDALHAFTAKVGKCDLFVMADDYFAARMKESADREEDPTETDRLSYEVFNIRLREDYDILERKMNSL